MKPIFYKAASVLSAASLLIASTASASHSWGGYHWSHSSAPLNLNVGDNVSSVWDPYLLEAISDWNTPTLSSGASDQLNLMKVAGRTKSNCRPTLGRIEVCNAKYGNTGWLGIARVWISGSHITQATTKLNDTYFNKAAYNTPAWRRLVMCQEIAHDFGLDHQDENFSNPNLGSCMDYTSDPDGPLSNEHPNDHDFEELQLIHGGHSDGAASLPSSGPGNSGQDVGEDPSSWGKLKRTDAHGNGAMYERNMGNGQKVVTFVTWADGAHGGH